jgi:hypothetical protein
MAEHIREAISADDIRRAERLLDESKHACDPVEKAVHDWNSWLDHANRSVAKLAIGMRLAMQLVQILAIALKKLEQTHSEWSQLVAARHKLWETQGNKPGLGAKLYQEYLEADSTLEKLLSMLVNTDDDYENMWVHIGRLDEIFAEQYGLDSVTSLWDKLPSIEDPDGDDGDDGDGGNGDDEPEADDETDGVTDLQGEKPN